MTIMNYETQEEADAASAKAQERYEKRLVREENHDKRMEAAAQLYALDVNSNISHRATIESYLAAQVEVNKEYNRIVAVNVVNVERIANALEQIAESLSKPVTFVSTP